jgi:hypothetical protein
MFDIRKIQEQVIFQAVKAQSNEETAFDIVYGGTSEGGVPGGAVPVGGTSGGAVHSGVPVGGTPGGAVTVGGTSGGKTASEGGAEDNPTWVKNTMKRLNGRFDPATVKMIRMNCQCGYGMDEKLALLKELMAGASNLDEFANNPKAKAAGLYYQDDALYLQFPFCPCPMLAEVDCLDDLTWCQCTTGYSKVLFEKAFGCEVEVELLKSVKAGDDLCLMKIVPLESVRFH